MSIFLFAALAFQQVVADPGTPDDQSPLFLEPTLESVTVPLFRLACRLYDPVGRTFVLHLAQEGGRGYEVAGEENPFRRFQATPITMQVLRDDTGEFVKRELEGEWIDQIRPHRIGAAILRQRNSKSEVESDSIMTLRFENAGAGRLSLEVTGESERFVAYVGFCDQSSTPQLPIVAPELGK